jgi:hypothetical protein
VSTVLIVAKTRMQQGHICVGAHDLADFRSLRLFRHDGRRIAEDAGLEVGDVWEMDYVDRADPTPPHLEDVLAQQGAHRIQLGLNPAALIMERDGVSPVRRTVVSIVSMKSEETSWRESVPGIRRSSRMRRCGW